MPTEYCEIKEVKTREEKKGGGIFKESTHIIYCRCEVHLIKSSGTEVILKSNEYSFSISPAADFEQDFKVREAARLEVLSNLISHGWEPVDGNFNTMKREIPSGPKQTSQESIRSRLENLKQFHEAGLITENEYTKRKEEILKEI